MIIRCSNCKYSSVDALNFGDCTNPNKCNLYNQWEPITEEDSKPHTKCAISIAKPYGKSSVVELLEDIDQLVNLSGYLSRNMDKNAKTDSVRDHNVGDSDYSKHKIQPWDIWLEYNLDPWDADIIKRVLRTKKGEDRSLAYKKIIHVCEEKLRQLDLE